MREGSSVQWGTIGGGMLRPLALKHYPITYWGVLDEAGDLLFPIFVNKDEGVVFGVSGIIFMPSFSGVHEFFFFVAN